MDYGELVKSAFWLSLRNRYLWFFGFFVGSSVPNFGGSIPNGGGGFTPNGPDSFRRGFGLFRRNLGRSLLVWLISLGLSLGVGIALLISALIVGLILFLPTIALGLAGYSTAAIATGAVAALILLPLFLVASGAVGTFNHAYWTLAYLRLAPRDAVPDPRTVA